MLGGSIGALMAYQSLYRRYRPQRFSEVKGQEPVVRALRNAANEDRVSHAYLFSGPRGTGKTSTARILAKILNCTNPTEGEPCGECDSCLAIEAGTSMDVHELDAASNNGVDAVRELISRAAIGTPGRTKVYILDEVHMLSKPASNALLKTLEEPPGHVVFILATTDPHKVLPTIKSRTQHLEFSLLGADEMSEHLRWVVGDAGIDVTPEAVEQVLKEGAGSARDALSALDRIAAGGGVAEGTESVDALVEALCERDTGAALAAVSADTRRGRDPRLVGEALLGRLRDAFLASMRADLGHLSDVERDVVQGYARRMTAPALTRGLELLGDALVAMRQAPDPRIPLEVALVRLTRPDSDTSVAALAERVDRLERKVAGAGTSGPPPAAPTVPEPASASAHEPSPSKPASSAPPPGAPSPSKPSPGDDARRALAGAERDTGVTVARASGEAKAGTARPALGARPRPATPAATPAATVTTTAQRPDPASVDVDEPEATGEPAGAMPDREAILAVWDGNLLGQLPAAGKARFRGGRFATVQDGVAVFAVPNDMHRQRCEEYRPEAEAILARHFGVPVPLRLVVDAEVVEASLAASSAAVGAVEAVGGADSEPEDQDETTIDPTQLVDAVGQDQSAVERLAEAFGEVEVMVEEPE